MQELEGGGHKLPKTSYIKNLFHLEGAMFLEHSGYDKT